MMKSNVWSAFGQSSFIQIDSCKCLASDKSEFVSRPLGYRIRIINDAFPAGHVGMSYRVQKKEDVQGYFK